MNRYLVVQSKTSFYIFRLDVYECTRHPFIPVRLKPPLFDDDETSTTATDDTTAISLVSWIHFKRRGVDVKSSIL